jgi:uncharacterized alkaline shock family protein YloU
VVGGQEKMSNREDDKYSKDLMPAETTDSTRISDDVLSTIAGFELAKIQGISAVGGGISDFLGRKSPSKGIKVEVADEKITIDVGVTVDYGINIPDVAHEIQTRLRKAITEMTGKFVSAVNVTIQGIRTNVDRRENVAKEDSQSSIKEE